MEAPTQEQRKRFLARVYFGVSDNPSDDVNPFDNMKDFLDSQLREMRFGQTQLVRSQSKLRFAYNYHKVLDMRKVILNVQDIYDAMSDEDVQNGDIVSIWNAKSTFILP